MTGHTAMTFGLVGCLAGSLYGTWALWRGTPPASSWRAEWYRANWASGARTDIRSRIGPIGFLPMALMFASLLAIAIVPRPVEGIGRVVVLIGAAGWVLTMALAVRLRSGVPRILMPPWLKRWIETPPDFEPEVESPEPPTALVRRALAAYLIVLAALTLATGNLFAIGLGILVAVPVVIRSHSSKNKEKREIGKGA